ncbi:MAG: molybdate ABC transporter substrate-binding protein [Actinophytocola sp.]|nr:molybdate ABC transporter substrate-binding protein [Actinophytocola sp.]
MSKKVAAIAVTALSALFALSGCASASVPSSDRTVTVFAAASLTETFGTLERRFEQSHPDVDVRLHFAGSATLAQQLTEGASADVFASANEDVMADVANADLLNGAPKPFATNTLTIAVEPGNPLGITDLDDLARKDVVSVACEPEVPCGDAARALIDRRGLDVGFASEERDVKAVLAKVSIGEADAGLVYVTDTRAAADKVDAVEIANAEDAVSTYPIATLADAPEPELAAEFERYVRGDGGAVLRGAGFGTP